MVVASCCAMIDRERMSSGWKTFAVVDCTSSAPITFFPISRGRASSALVSGSNSLGRHTSLARVSLTSISVKKKHLSMVKAKRLADALDDQIQQLTERSRRRCRFGDDSRRLKLAC